MPNTLLKNPVQINTASTAASLSVSGTSAAATTGTGVQPANTLTVEGTTGQETTGTGETAGAGAHLSIIAGSGGAAPAGSTTGAGGSVTINPGQPGSGAGTPGANGHVLLATTGGNVGIGNSTPTNRLDVNGDVRVNSLGVNIAPGEDGTFALGGVQSPSVYLNSTTATSDVYLQNSEGRLDVLAHDGATVNMSVTNNGHVGIGTTTPGSSLDVSGGVRAGSIGVNTTPGGTGTFSLGGVANPNVRLNSTTASSDVYLQNSAGRFDILANDGATMYLSVTNTGNVGIGTSSPGNRLEVAGGARASAIGVNMAPGFTGTLGVGGVQNPNVKLNSTSASSDVYLQNSAGRLDVLGNDGTTVNLSVSNAGKVGIGTTGPLSTVSINGPGIASRGLCVKAPGTSVPFEVIGSGGVHTTYVLPNTSGVNLISSNCVSGSTYLPLAFSDRETKTDLVIKAGLVGIHTAAPGQLLDAQGAITSNPALRVMGSDTASFGLLQVGPNVVDAGGGNTGGIGTRLILSDVGTSGKRWDLSSGGVTPGALTFKNASDGVTALTALSTGNVGVGTPTPGSRLHINGGVQVGAPTGGDKGTGSINIAGDIYKNGTPQLKKLEELAKRIERLEAQLGRKAGKPAKPSKSKKPAKLKKKSGKSRKEKR